MYSKCPAVTNSARLALLVHHNLYIVVRWVFLGGGRTILVDWYSGAVKVLLGHATISMDIGFSKQLKPRLPGKILLLTGFAPEGALKWEVGGGGGIGKRRMVQVPILPFFLPCCSDNTRNTDAHDSTHRVPQSHNRSSKHRTLHACQLTGYPNETTAQQPTNSNLTITAEVPLHKQVQCRSNGMLTQRHIYPKESAHL